MSDPLSTPVARMGTIRTALLVPAVAIAAGIAAALCDVSPTGSRWQDVTITFVVAVFVSWAGASAPWWAITAAGLIATAGTAFGPWMVPAVASTAIGVTSSFTTGAGGGRFAGPLPWLRTCACGLVLLSLLNLRVDPFLGASAIVAGVVMLALAISGIVRRPGPVRARAIWTMVAALVAAVLAAAGMAFGALQAQDKLELGNRLLTDGFDQLRAGDTARAAETLAVAAANLRGAAGELDSAWTAPARYLPVVAQHRALATEIVSKAAASAAAAARALDAADVDQLRLMHGSLDLALLGTLAQPFADHDASVHELSAAFDGGDSPWLISAVRTELGKARPDIDAALVQTEAIAAVTGRGPAMMGSDGTRRYLVAFTSPGQARGQGGVVDDFAEITVSNGTIEQSGSGRSADLIADLAAAAPLHLRATQEYFDRYGPLGAGSSTTAVDPAFWSKATMDPDTARVADVLSQMYAAAGHNPVDGVIIIDPIGLAGLLQVAGPVDLTYGDPPVTEHVDADRLRQFLLVDQYQLDGEQRRLAIEAAAGAAMQQFLAAALPSPQLLGEALGPPATEGHIAWWARRPEEQAVIELIGMAAKLPAPGGSDGLAIVSNNLAGNAVDAFLRRTVRYTPTYDPATGDVAGDVVVTLENTAPTTGYDASVIGNDLGLPTGTNRMALSIYTPLAAGAVTVDGAAVTVQPSTELGWNVSTLQVDIPPGQTRTVQLRVSGRLDTAAGYRFVWRPQPLTTPETFDLAVAGTHIAYSGQLVRTSVIDADGVRAER